MKDGTTMAAGREIRNDEEFDAYYLSIMPDLFEEFACKRKSLTPSSGEISLTEPAEPAPSATLSVMERLLQAEEAAEGAFDALAELHCWQIDESEDVRALADNRLKQIAAATYIDQLQSVETEDPRRSNGRMERWLRRVFASPPDAPPGWRERGKTRVRALLIGLGALLHAAVAILILQSQFEIAIAVLLLAGLFDMAEGVFARAARVDTPVMRWASCVLSQAGDLLPLGAIVFTAYLFVGQSLGMAWALLLAGTLSTILAAYVRVAALQAGHPFWLSRPERVARYVAILASCSAFAHGWNEIGAAAAGLALLGSALWEFAVVAEASFRIRMRGEGFALFVDANNRIHELRFGDSTCNPFDPSILESEKKRRLNVSGGRSIFANAHRRSTAPGPSMRMDA